MDTKRQKIQMELAFMAENRGEAPMAVNKGTEVPMAKREPEDPALTVLLMEQICQRENLRKALLRVRQNKGGAGIDRIANSLTSRTAVVRTRMPGGVTGKAREGIPMSILRILFIDISYNSSILNNLKKLF
jgi:hypothetical protein